MKEYTIYHDTILKNTTTLKTLINKCVYNFNKHIYDFTKNNSNICTRTHLIESNNIYKPTNNTISNVYDDCTPNISTTHNTVNRDFHCFHEAYLMYDNIDHTKITQKIADPIKKQLQLFTSTCNLCVKITTYHDSSNKIFYIGLSFDTISILQFMMTNQDVVNNLNDHEKKVVISELTTATTKMKYYIKQVKKQKEEELRKQQEEQEEELRKQEEELRKQQEELRKRQEEQEKQRKKKEEERKEQEELRKRQEDKIKEQEAKEEQKQLKEKEEQEQKEKEEQEQKAIEEQKQLKEKEEKAKQKQLKEQKAKEKEEKEQKKIEIYNNLQQTPQKKQKNQQLDQNKSNKNTNSHTALHTEKPINTPVKKTNNSIDGQENVESTLNNLKKGTHLEQNKIDSSFQHSKKTPQTEELGSQEITKESEQSGSQDTQETTQQPEELGSQETTQQSEQSGSQDKQDITQEKSSKLNMTFWGTVVCMSIVVCALGIYCYPKDTKSTFQTKSQSSKVKNKLNNR